MRSPSSQNGGEKDGDAPPLPPPLLLPLLPLPLAIAGLPGFGLARVWISGPRTGRRGCPTGPRVMKDPRAFPKDLGQGNWGRSRVSVCLSVCPRVCEGRGLGWRKDRGGVSWPYLLPYPRGADAWLFEFTAGGLPSRKIRSARQGYARS
jgi:hypothetical protein